MRQHLFALGIRHVSARFILLLQSCHPHGGQQQRLQRTLLHCEGLIALRNPIPKNRLTHELG